MTQGPSKTLVNGDTLLRLAPAPEPRAGGIEWDVFVSYRSVNRNWAMALYDSLREAKFKVFLDQFVLPIGVEIDGFLRQNLQSSASGVVVWSGDAATSQFVKGELATMRELKRKRPSFRYVLAKLDAQELPFLEQNDLYVDFTAYPEGPRGGELLRLMFGLLGRPLSDQAAREIHDVDVATSALIKKIKAAKAVGNATTLVQLGQQPLMSVTSLPPAVLSEALIELGENDAALQVIAQARETFSRALRLRQLQALAYRRTQRIEDAQLILNELHVGGHRDPETLGILGSTWMQRYRQERKRVYLEHSQGLYAEAYRLSPDSYFNGINAASKAAFLGKFDDARRLATEVLALVKDHQDGSDYWATATHAEARLLCGEYPESARLYRAAVVGHLMEIGSIGSTRAQAEDLLHALAVDEGTQQMILAAFSLA